MAISRVNFTSFQNFYNNVNSGGATAQTATATADSVYGERPKVSKKQLGLGAAIATLGLLLLSGVRKLGSVLQKVAKYLKPFVESKISNSMRKMASDGVEIIEPEVVDTRFLRPRSKLRMRPEIIDVDFVEIKN